MVETIVITATTLAEPGLELLRRSGRRTIFIDPKSGEDQLAHAMANEQVVGVVSRTMILPGAAIKACRTLRVISKHGVGVDNIDVDAATACSIPVLIAPAANAQSVAEMTVALMLGVARHLTTHNAAIRGGRWNRNLDGLQLEGRTLGLVGLGDIGRRVGAIATAMGMTVLAYDPAQAAGARQGNVEIVGGMEELLKRSSVLSVHCPLNSRTKGLVGAKELALLPKGAIIVNTARGGIIDEGALHDALTQGHLAGAGLDSFVAEPLPSDHPLLTHPNMIVTPHMGGSTIEALGEVSRISVQQMLDALQGLPIDPAVCVNPGVLPVVHA